MDLRFGVIGSGSWGTALTKMLLEQGHPVSWWVRHPENRDFILQHGHNPHYLRSARLPVHLLRLSCDVREVVQASDVVVVAVPSAYVAGSLAPLQPADWDGKRVVSAIKGLLPGRDILLNEYLQEQYGVPLDHYFAILGPCHAEEVAEEKLSYLTLSGRDLGTAARIAAHFNTPYINTIVNHDILGVQYAAVLKNIYALGAGIAHGLDYGDNFLSVYIANAADEMAGFLKKFGFAHITVGEHEGEDPVTHRKTPNYAASVYLGDLLVTCYSPHSRNRRFGSMIGKGYSVDAARLEMNMVAEGHAASRCIAHINQRVQASMPLAEAVYRILWENVIPAEGFKRLEQVLI